MRFLLTLLLLFACAVTHAATIDQISGTVTVTNAPTTNGCTITVNSDTRTQTNNVLLNPAIYFSTNSTKNGVATNLLNHSAQFTFSNLRATYADTNAVKYTARPGDALTITIGGSWASVTYSTQRISNPFTWVVRTPLSIEAATNATNIANSQMVDLTTYPGTPPITNATSAGVSNAAVKPLLIGRSGSLLQFKSIEAGSDVGISMTDTSAIINAAVTAVTNLNSLTNRSQWFTVQTTGADFTITTSTTTGVNGTNFINLPFATNTAHGKLRSNDWSAFNSKQTGSATLTNLSATGAHTNAAVLLYRGPTNSGIGAPLILKAGSGISMATNSSTNFVVSCTLAPVGIPDFTNAVTRWFVADGHTNLAGVGDYASTNGLNNASKFLSPDGTDGSRVQWDGSGSVTTTNGFAGQKLYYSTFNPQIAGRFSITNSSDNFRAWFGFTDTTFGEMMEGKQPTGLTLAAFRHWDDASTWYAVTSWSGNYEENDTGITHDGASHTFDIRCSASSVVFYIDGVAKMTNSTQIPQFNPTPMRPILQFRNISDGHDLQCEWVRMKSDR